MTDHAPPPPAADPGLSRPGAPDTAGDRSAGMAGPGGPGAASRGATAFIFVTVLLDMIGFGLIIPVLPQLIEEVGHVGTGRAAAIGSMLFAAYAVAQFLCGPLMGNLSDAFGRRPLLLLAIGGLAADYVLTALAPSLGWLFAGRLIAGVCGASYVIANAYIADVTTPDERAKAFGMMGAAFGLGFVIGPALGALLGAFGPRVPFWAAAVLAGLNFAFGLFVLPESLAPDRRRPFDIARANPFGAFRVFRSYPTVWPYLVTIAVLFFGGSVYQAIWPFWGAAQFGWDERMIGLTLAAFGLVQAITQGALAGPLVARFGEHRVAFWGLVAGVVAMVGYGLAGSLAVVLVLFVVHAPEGLVHPSLTALMSKDVPEDAQGELQGGLASLLAVTMLVGTLFFGFVFAWAVPDDQSRHAPGLPFLVAAMVLVVALGLFARAERQRARAGTAIG